jgi:outer membrane protein OmpA-like peptidoglycan-associated protein
MTIVRAAVLAILIGIPVVTVGAWIKSAEARLEEITAPPEAAPRAAASDESYCNPELKKILRRVLLSCGLMGDGAGVRGCQPVQAKNVATLSGNDFNALFQPMKGRGGIVQFDVDKAELDPGDVQLVDQVFSDQKGASWFFVVARSSPEGSVEHNRELSRARADAVMNHLRQAFKDPDLEKEVGLLWLGEEFAQLDPQFCAWRRSIAAGGDPAATCTAEEINRSAFIAWIDCQL